MVVLTLVRAMSERAIGVLVVVVGGSKTLQVEAIRVASFAHLTIWFPCLRFLPFLSSSNKS